ncbi:MAG: DUF1732 domain-containing protein [Hyphomonas sp.]|uniref:YicC family protein n=1 Tax=Hyphomonas sp. TaxID=87 RepID=UPI0034A07E49
MTGFARVTGEERWGAWAWEAKSVNGRSLDVRVNYPPGFDTFEREVKAMAVERFNRGSLQVSLRIDLPSGGAGVVVDHGLLNMLMDAARAAHGGELNAEAVVALMSLKGVVEPGNASTRELAGDEAVMATIGTGARAAMDQLAEARRAEGADLMGLLSGHLVQIEAFSAEAAVCAATQPGLIKAKLQKQLVELDREGRVDAERFAAEAALSAARADVREELDRVGAHVKSGRELLKAGSPAGRKIDFLAQELNREANTLCSKSASLDLTNAGLSLKGVIDQFKEQAANVE